MKRLISGMLLLLMLVCAMTTGFAASRDQKITIRNGIAFGMTLEEVVGLEQAKNPVVSESGLYYRYENVTVADIEDCAVNYYFKEETGLFRVMINFRTDPSKYISYVDAESRYLDINNILLSKYGNFLGNRFGYTHSVQTSSLQFHRQFFEITRFLASATGGSARENYDEWALDVEGGHVKIDHVMNYRIDSEREVVCNHMIDYTFYTDAEWEAEQKNFTKDL